MPYPEIDPVFIGLGPLQIRWYALAYIAGILAGWYYLAQLLKTPALWQGPRAIQTAPPMNRAQLDDVLFYVTLGIIAGGRLGFVFFYRPELLIEPFSRWPEIFGFLPFPPALAIWQGGMSFHGGLLGVMAATFYFARKHRLDPFAIGDLFACAAPIGLFFGRLANFINAELYGRPTDSWVGMVFPKYFSEARGEWVYGPLDSAGPTPDYTREQWLASGDAVPRHPSQLYEAFLEGVVLFILVRIAVTRFKILRFPGAATGLFVGGYGLARFCVEFFREPDKYEFAGPIGFLTRGMMLSLPMVAIGAYLFWWAWNKQKKKDQQEPQGA